MARRVLLKISGEAFANSNQALAPERFTAIAKDLEVARSKGVEIAVVVGAGNFLRGASATNSVLTRVTADHMAMLATVMNGLALRDALDGLGVANALYSALPVDGIVKAFDYREAREDLLNKKIVILGGGTGNPLVTTDSTASLRGAELDVDVVLKATKVDGIYDKDPVKFKDAKRYTQLNFAEVLKQELQVMDLGAFCQCRDFGISIQVFNLFKPGALLNALLGSDEGTVVSN